MKTAIVVALAILLAVGVLGLVIALAFPVNWLVVKPNPTTRTAQSNLVNFLEAANGLYLSRGHAFPTMDVAAFYSSAPEFHWAPWNCTATPANCVSYHVLDAKRADGAQVLVLADRDGPNGKCWYEAEVQVTPILRAVTGRGVGDLHIATAGTYYAMSNSGQKGCSATDPLTDPAGSGWGADERWFETYSSVSAPG